MKTIERKSLADEVAAQIRQNISAGAYSIGDKLPVEAELMSVFGVGRSTIREAVKILSNSGYVRVQQGLGTFVEDAANRKTRLYEQFEGADIYDLDEVRCLLEMKIAEKAALNRTKEDIEIIRGHLQERGSAAAKGLLRECIEADIKFHVAISAASKNKILGELYQVASNRLKEHFLKSYQSTDSFIKTHKLHAYLLEYIISGNARKAQMQAEKIIKKG